MAVDANTLTRYDDPTVKESLAADIMIVAQEETPFLSTVPRIEVGNSQHEWGIDDLPDADDSGVLDGDEFAAEPVSPGTRAGNYLQITRRQPQVSRRSDLAAQSGGREMARQMAKMSMAHKRDIEAISLRRRAAVRGARGTIPLTAGVPTWIRTNFESVGTTTAPAALVNGFPTGSPGASTAVAQLTEAKFLAALLKMAEGGAKPKLIMSNLAIRQKFSNYWMSSDSARIAQPYKDDRTTGGMYAASASVARYISDFGTIDMVPNFFMRRSVATGSVEGADVLILDTDYWCLAYFIQSWMALQDPARTGDYRRQMLLSDFAVVSKNEKGSAVVAGVNDTAAVVAGS